MTKSTKKAQVTKVESFDLTKFPSKSAAIRSLSSEGKTRSAIVKLIPLAPSRPIRHHLVLTVLITPLVGNVSK